MRASAAFEARCGGMAARCTVRKPRNYTYRFPRKKLQSAMRSALSAKLSENSLAVIESLAPESSKTKDFQKTLSGMGYTGKVLIVDSSRNKNLASLFAQPAESEAGSRYRCQYF